MSKHLHITIEDVGNSVICDFCGEDWTGRPETGGFLFQSKAVCPDCAKRMLPNIKQYNEEHFIRARCPEGASFYNWVLSLTKGPRVIKTITIDDKAED